MSKATYMITPLGLLGKSVCDKLMLHMYKSGKNGIVLDKGELQIVQIRMEKQCPEKNKK